MESSAPNCGKKDNQYYRVVLCGRFKEEMHPWFDGLKIEIKGETTILTGMMRDQTELHGLLRKIHDLHQTLLSVEVVDNLP